MADQGLEQRVAALEAQAGGGQQVGQVGGGQQTGEAQGAEQMEGLMVQAFLQGALAAQAADQVAQGLSAGTGGPQEQGFFGRLRWNPTKYDSFIWCKSRAMCNPQSISCLC